MALMLPCSIVYWNNITLKIVILILKVANIKKTLKATASTSLQEPDQHPMDRDAPQLIEQRSSTKKLSKAKSLSSSRH